MAEQTDVLQELKRRAGAGELNQRQQAILQELERRLAPQAPPYQRPTRVGDPRAPLQAGLEPESLQAAMTAPTVPDIRYGPPLEPGLEEGFTDPRTMALTIGGGLAGSAGMRAGMALAPFFTNPIARAAAPYLGSAAGSEAVNLAAKATEPGATVGSVLTPDLSDVVATGVPLAAGARDIGRAAAGALARSSRAGKVAQESVKKQTADASRASAQAFNDQVQADFDLSTAKQAHTRAMDQARLDDDLRSYNALLERHTAEKARQAEVIRGLTQAQREGNVAKAADYVARLPNIPSADDVAQSYAGVQSVAQSYKTPIVLPELQKVQQQLIKEADSVRKIPGGAGLANTLEAIGSAGADETLSLADIQTGLRLMKAHVRTLNRSTSEYAGTQARAYGRLIEAMEEGLKNLADNDALPDTFRGLLRSANAQYLKYATHEELTDFVTNAMVRPGPGGVPQFSPQVALRALESKQYAPMKRYMQQTAFEELGGKNLYDLTKETLTAMAGSDVAEKGALIAQRRALQPPVRPELPPTSPSGVPRGLGLVQQEVPPAYQPGDTAPGTGAILASLAARGILGTSAALLASSGQYHAALPLAAGMVGLPNTVAALLSQPWGQRLILRLMQEQGPRLTPTMMGFINAAVQTQMPGRQRSDVAP